MFYQPDDEKLLQAKKVCKYRFESVRLPSLFECCIIPLSHRPPTASLFFLGTCSPGLVYAHNKPVISSVRVDQRNTAKMSLAFLLWTTHPGGWSMWQSCGVSFNQKPCITQRNLRSTWIISLILKEEIHSLYSVVWIFGWRRLFLNGNFYGQTFCSFFFFF